MSAPTAERICDRCRLVFGEALPSAKGWTAVCPRCGLVPSIADVARLAAQEPKR